MLMLARPNVCKIASSASQRMTASCQELKILSMLNKTSQQAIINKFYFNLRSILWVGDLLLSIPTPLLVVKCLARQGERPVCNWLRFLLFPFVANFNIFYISFHCILQSLLPGSGRYRGGITSKIVTHTVATPVQLMKSTHHTNVPLSLFYLSLSLFN